VLSDPYLIYANIESYASNQIRKSCAFKVTMALCGCDPHSCGFHGNVTFTIAHAKGP
jgi:hypothetical protein